MALLSTVTWSGIARAESSPPSAELVDASEAEPRAEAPVKLGPKRLPYDPSQPIPAGYSLVKRKRLGLVISGGVTLGVSYGLTALIGLTAIAADESWYGAPLLVPVAGPVISLIQLQGHGDGLTRFALGTVSLLSGAVQGLGTGLLIAGLVSGKNQLVRNDLLGGALGDNVRLVPTVGRESSGLMLLGSF